MFHRKMFFVMRLSSRGFETDLGLGKTIICGSNPNLKKKNDITTQHWLEKPQALWVLTLWNVYNEPMRMPSISHKKIVVKT